MSAWWRVVESAPAQRRTAPAVAAAHGRLCREGAWRLGEAGQQLGHVKLWKARAVNVSFFWTPPLLPRDEDEDAPDEPKASPQAGVAGDDLRWRLAVRLQVPPEMLLRAEGPLAWPAPFYEFQREGITALLGAPRLLLGDEMGLGKSVQAIAALRVLLHRRSIERALLVAPASLLEQWRREFARWASELVVMSVQGPAATRRWQWRFRAHVTLVSYETLRADWRESADGGTPGAVPWGVVVLDEAQKIKNPGAEISAICRRLPRARSWALTGTPLENSPLDVLAILRFVLQNEGAGEAEQAMPLRFLLARHLLRRTKAQVLRDLPPKIVTEVPLALLSPQRAAYERAAHEGLMQLRGGDVPIQSVLALLTRLKQLCNFEPHSGASAKLEDLRERLREVTANGQSALVFTQFTDEVFGARRLAAALREFAPLLFTGDMDGATRDGALRRFQEGQGAAVLIVSLRAGGQGLNLQRASYVFHFDQWWNPALLQQAEDRAHRLGQTQPVHVYRYRSVDTVEERIADLLRDKQETFEQVVEEAALDPARRFSAAELCRMAGLSQFDGLAKENL